jgi:hypothetical protein
MGFAASGLLQAIARVNRVFRDKPGGLVVDYIGIADDLRSSLQAYDETDRLEQPLYERRIDGHGLGALGARGLSARRGVAGEQLPALRLTEGVRQHQVEVQYGPSGEGSFRQEQVRVHGWLKDAPTSAVPVLEEPVGVPTASVVDTSDNPDVVGCGSRDGINLSAPLDVRRWDDRPRRPVPVNDTPRLREREPPPGRPAYQPTQASWDLR